MPLLFDANISAVMTFANILIQIFDCRNGQTHFNIYEAVVLLTDVWNVGNQVFFWFKQSDLHQGPVSVQDDCTTDLPALILWISLDIDIAFITKRR